MTSPQLPPESGQPPATVLGLGPMGRALVDAFLRADHPTTGWNRTAGKADDLAARGMVHAATPADAVTASGLIVVCVIDNAVVRAILSPVAEAMRGRTLVNLTSDCPQEARAMAEWAAAHGIDYLDGAIITPATAIGGPDGIILYGGPEKVYATHRTALGALGGTGIHLGPDPGLAAAYDVALLDIFWTCMSGVAHAFALARAEGVEPMALEPYVKAGMRMLPGIAAGHAERIAAGSHPGDHSSIQSAAAGMEHIACTAEARGIDSTVIRAILDITRRAVDAGCGGDGFSRMADVFVDRANLSSSAI